MLHFKEIDPGSLAQWVSALLTVGTLYMSLRLYRREQDNRRREQARKVNAWPGDLDFDKNEVTAWVRNSGDEPVYNMHILGYLLESTHPFYYDWRVTWNEYAQSPSGEAIKLTSIQKLPLPDACRNPPISIPSVAIQITFVDASGRQWTRDPSGQLTELRPRRMSLKYWFAIFKWRFIFWHQRNRRRRRASYMQWLYDYLDKPYVWNYNADRVRWRYVKHPRGREYRNEKTERLRELLDQSEPEDSPPENKS